ncbi:RcnB family protein [Asticcacaulis sp. 201]|uniref:RcnB family protein n=1 Tax=Asticcacaulis sp. 201 TaxID=3028787 RepID=UPI0029168D45|nr:RcnB family protein [Asticcacaulis sp. 201]MDV6330150.1 RcnB family protein [Asticcacaulis sp. 201]
MKRFLTSTALAVLAGTLAFGSVASADPRDHDRYDRHERYDRHDRYDRGDRDWRRDRYDRRDAYRDGYRDGRDRGYHNGWRDRSDWRRGGYVSYVDWHRGYVVDYRHHHLRRPPYGYEWRRVDNNYVLAAVATGLIASVIINSY